MTYEHIVTGTFVSRPNRFIAHVKTGNRTVVCHVKNTGRCRELLIPGVTVILEFHPDAAVSGRKTEYDLIGVYKNDLFINMDSQAPNKAAWEWLTSLDGSMDSRGCAEKAGSPFSPLGPYVPCDIRREGTRNGGLFGEGAYIRPETKYGTSRFDLYIEQGERKIFMEVKGVTLEENGLALFPDAPTKRGIKHLKGLIRAHEEGYEAYVLFVIQMKGIRGFTPNDMTHPAFGDALRQAREAGVHVLAYDCLVTPDTMIVDSPVKVILD